MKVTVFPYLQPRPGTRPNPYIHDMVQALSALPGVEVVNPPHCNPLLSLLKPGRQGDVVILNWFESIPDFRHGYIQTFIAVLWFVWLKLRGRKVVWMLHNKHPHHPRRRRLKELLTRLAAHGADLIITHATDGVELVRQRFPRQAAKAHFLHHPTKDRLGVPADVPPACDYLVWGHITAYKGVLELLEYLAARPQTFRVCIVGGCSDESLRRRIEAVRLPNVDCRFHAPSFEELRTYLDRSRFVLVPYHAASVLSSGILMDSLAFGAKVVGPDTGSFKDYAREPRLKVYTFRSFDDLAPLLAAHGDEPASTEAYRDFLTENDWAHFVRRLCRLLEGGRDSC